MQREHAVRAYTAQCALVLAAERRAAVARLALVAEDVDRASRGDHTWGRMRTSRARWAQPCQTTCGR